MLSDEFPEYRGKAPDTLGGSPVSLHLYVEDVDAFVKKALAAGAKERKSLVGGHSQGRRRAGGDAEARGGDVFGEQVGM